MILSSLYSASLQSVSNGVGPPFVGWLAFRFNYSLVVLIDIFVKCCSRSAIPKNVLLTRSA